MTIRWKNLQILCSNCHMQAHGYSNVAHKKIHGNH